MRRFDCFVPMVGETVYVNAVASSEREAEVNLVDFFDLTDEQVQNINIVPAVLLVDTDGESE